MNVIFAGDFAQLPPPTDARLYGRIDGEKCSKSSVGQDIIFGKLLWLSVQTVVFLTQQHWQMGDNNGRFVELLSRLREGRCNNRDNDLLHLHVLSLLDVNEDPGWRAVPIIVATNAAKDALNECMAKQFALNTGQELHWYYAIDHISTKNTNSGGVIEDKVLIEQLQCLHSGKTKQCLGKIPLVLGMPVLVAHNFDVGGRITNGTRGTIKKITYTVDVHGIQHLMSVIIHCPEVDQTPMQNLPAGYYPIIANSVTLKFEHPYNKSKWTILCTQVSIVPAFAMTAHRVQRMTLDHVIVDLESCSGTESLYVMLSRVHSLNGVTVLCFFLKKRITCSLSKDM
ncbi:hypothetical protein J132_07652 [Termitomyces sp. J132]|nr:hypothetical protein J132_07652 [Termitomyces sp. J132]